MKALDVPVGARIPKELKKKLDHFCQEHGLKMSYVVAVALEDKLGELEEELDDRALAKARLKDAEFVSQADYDAYVKRRLTSC
jgi:predicted DNA-binding protein